GRSRNRMPVLSWNAFPLRCCGPAAGCRRSKQLSPDDAFCQWICHPPLTSFHRPAENSAMDAPDATGPMRNAAFPTPPEFDGAVAWAAWLYYVDQLNQSEVAKAMNVSRASVVNYL